MQRLIAYAAVGWLGFTSSLLAAGKHDGVLECFDVEVRATLVRQSPTKLEEANDGSILTSWPWILDLKVEETDVGSIPRSVVTVQHLQHAEYHNDVGPRRWWLQRNAENTFNVISIDERPDVPHCRVGSAPVRPLIHLHGRSLEEIRLEGEAWSQGERN